MHSCRQLFLYLLRNNFPFDACFYIDRPPLNTFAQSRLPLSYQNIRRELRYCNKQIKRMLIFDSLPPEFALSACASCSSAEGVFQVASEYYALFESKVPLASTAAKTKVVFFGAPTSGAASNNSKQQRVASNILS
jgi:hypothetical protein